jgi:hypothetical protein
VPDELTAVDIARAKKLGENYSSKLGSANTTNEDKARGIIATSPVWQEVVTAAHEMLDELVTWFADSAAAEAKQWLKAQLEEIVISFVANILKSWGLVGDAASLVKNVGASVKAGWETFVTRKLEDGIKSGAPKIIIEGVRDQIKDYGLKSFGKAVVSALTMGLNAALPGVGEVIDTIKTILVFIHGAFVHYHDLSLFKKVIKDAGVQHNAQLYTKPLQFQTWFVEAVKTMPIISSYCLVMPMTGSYMSFLSVMSEEGKPLSDSELKENKKLFEKVKGDAKEFVQWHSVQLSSTDALVHHSLTVAHGDAR